MATENNVNVNVNVTSNNTTAKETRAAERYRDVLEQAAQSASKIKVGGTAGSRAMAEASQPVSAQLEQRNISRGVAGETGASARDFAAQSQGLSGLVRIYAVYAANLYAVGAAFRALSTAMDTANMVKGLDQIGAVSGTSLGSLSKQLVKATDGAISLREAMSATVKVSTAGFDSETVLRLGNVAKKASQALGIDMSDAISRLSRGITKLEPELLDELGIFTKLDKSTEDYAKSVGKSVSQLTDFEKRAAFANAVLTEGEKKFKSIKIDANPYTKLLASLQDLTTEALKFVNIALVPIVNYLATSPTALTTVIALLGVQLARTTIPKLLEVKQAFDAISTSSAKLATGKKNEAIKALLPDIVQVRDAANTAVNAYYTTLESSQEKALSLVKGSTKQKLSAIFGRGEEATTKDLAYIEQLKAKAGANSELNKALDEYTKSLNGIITKEAVYAEASKKTKEIINQRYNLTKAVGQLQIIAANELQNARSKEIVSNVAATTSTKGLWAGLKELGKTTITAAKEQKILTDEIEVTAANGKTYKQTIETIIPKMGALKAASTLVVGGFASIATAATTLGRALLTFLPYIGLIIAGFEALNYFFSGNAKEQKVFEDAVSKSEDSVANLKRTIDLIKDKPISEKFNTESLMASATAINEMSIATTGLLKGIIDLDKKASPWDRFIDGFKIMAGGGARKEFAKNITETVVGALDAAYGSPAAAAAREKIAKIFQIDKNFSKKQFEEAAAGAADNEIVLNALNVAVKTLGFELISTASKSKSFDDALAASGKAYTDFTNQFALKDPLTLLALSFSKSGAELAEVMKEPQQIIQKLFEISKDAEKIKLFSAEDQQNLRTYSKDLASVNEIYQRDKEALRDANLELEKQKRLFDEFKTEVAARRQKQGQSIENLENWDFVKKAEAAVDKARAEQDIKQKTFAISEQRAKELIDKFPNIAYGQLVKGGEALAASIEIALAKGSTALANAAAGILGDLPGTAALREQTANKQLNAQIRLADITLELIKVTREATNQQAVLSAKEDLRMFQAADTWAQAQGQPADKSGKEAELKKRVEQKEQFQQAYLKSPQEALKTALEIASANKDNRDVQQQVADLQKYIAQVSGIQAEKLAAEDQKRANALTKRVSVLAEENSIKQQTLDRAIQTNTVELEGLQRVEKLAGFLTEEQINRESQLKTTILLNQQEKERNDAELKRQAILKTIEVLGKDATGNAERQAALAQLEKDIKDKIPEKQRAQEATLRFETQQKINASVEREANFKIKLQSLDRDRQNTLDNTAQQLLEINAATMAAVLPLSPQYIAIQEAYVKSKRDELTEQQNINALTTEYINTIGKLQRERATLGTGPEFAARRAEIEKELTLQEQLFNAKKSQIEQIAAAQKDADAQKLAYNLRELDYAERLQKITDSVKGLANAFGDLGGKLAGAVVSITEFNISQDKSADKLKAISEAIKASQEAGVVNPNLIKEQSKLQEKAKRDEISGYAQMAGAAKSMFKEKTGAYRAFAAVEKALLVYRLMMDAQKIASEASVTIAAVTGSATRIEAGAAEMGVNAGVSISNQGKGDPYSAWPRIAAMTALMVGVLAAFGGKGGSVSGGGGITSAQRQETQGTGQKYNAQGQLVETGGGVFGDPTAKNEGISRSIEIMKDNIVIGTKYNNRALYYLEQINSNIQKAAQSLFKVGGLRTGSMFGTQEGTQSQGGLAGLLGGKRSTEIIDSGIKIVNASFNDLADGVAGAALQYYETVRTTTSNFFRTRSRVSENVQQANAAWEEYFAGVFSNARKLFMELGKKLGYTADEVTAQLGNVVYNLTEEQVLSLRGLKGQEFVDQLSAYTGNLLDTATKQLFGDIVTNYQKFGETALETLVRVTDTNTKIEQQIYNLGFGRLREDLKKTGVQVTEFDSATGQALRTYTSYDPKDIANAAIGITENLAEIAGGLDKFLETTNQYLENFYSKEERNALKRAEVFNTLGDILEPEDKTDRTAAARSTVLSRALSQLNLSLDQGAENAIDTREEWRTLVETVAKMGPEGQALSVVLMGLGNDFATFTEESSNAIRDTLAGAKDKITENQEQIKKLQRPGYEAGNAFWDIVDSLEANYQALVDNNMVTDENVRSIIDLANSQRDLIIAQNQRKTEEQLAAFELEAATKSLTGFAQVVAGISSKAVNLVKSLLSMGTATDANVTRIRQAARQMYDSAIAANELKREEILLGVSSQTASLGLSQLGKELNNITTSIINTAKQLAEIGQLTDAAIETLVSSAETQMNFAREQNRKQGQNILSGFAKETANQGLSQVAQQVQGIGDKARGAIEQLAQLGQATEENIGYIIALAEQQVAFVRAQNARQARELVVSKNTELITKNLGQLGQELLGISQQAQDATRQLVDLGQATDENVAAIQAWQNAMVASAKRARLSAQEEQYAQVFSGNATEALAAKFKRLGFTLPSSVKQFKQLVDAIDTTTIAGIDLRGQLLDLGSEFTGLIEQTSSALRSAYDARVGELTDARDKFKDFSDTLKDFKKSLLTGQLSPLTPQQQYQVNREEFLRVSALAGSGDAKAMQQLQTVSSAFLESSRGMFASSEAYTQDFQLVSNALDSSVSFAELQVQIANNTLDEIKNVVGGLIDINDSVANSDVVLTGVGTDLQKAIADYSLLLNSSSIDISNWEATSANTRNALLDSSLYVQQQIDSGIANVAASASNMDVSLGNVAEGIVNMDTGDAGNLGDLRSTLHTMQQNQNSIDFSSIDTAITEALNDPDNPTVAALNALNTLTQTYGEEQTNGAGIFQRRHEALYFSLAEINRTLTKPAEIIVQQPDVNVAVSVPVYYASLDPGDASPGLATGTNYVPEDMVVQIHKGERVVPAADNAKLMEKLSQSNDLQEEIQQLNIAIKELQQVVAEGAVMNAQATERNTEAITSTISDTRSERQYLKKIQDRTSIV